MNRPASMAVSTALQGGRLAVRGFGMATASMRPDPDFLLIGAKRGGSTSFYFDLLTHPQVGLLFPRPDRLPKAVPTKGVHYFDSNYSRGHRWYASHLPSARVRSAQERRARGTVVVGEGSPYYLTHPASPERVATDLPNVKLLAVLRDPALRAYSHWKERSREGRERLSFLDALAAEPDRTGKDAARLAADPSFYSYAHEHQTYLGQSHYGAAVSRWREHFSAEQMHIVRSEDYYADPERALAGAADFLGIRSTGFTHGQPMNAAPGSDIDETTQEHLHGLLREDAIRLGELTGVTWDWV